MVDVTTQGSCTSTDYCAFLATEQDSCSSTNRRSNSHPLRSLASGVLVLPVVTVGAVTGIASIPVGVAVPAVVVIAVSATVRAAVIAIVIIVGGVVVATVVS